MPFCPFVFSAVADELRRKVAGAKVDKITQPEKDRLVLTLRGGGASTRPQTVRLLLCARSGSARVHLTTQSFDNPAEPPMFCMLLRKYLSGARLVSIVQPDFERMLIFSFNASDELGYERCVKLVFESAGRVPNIILTDGEDRILDCLKRADLDANAIRPLLPGLYYHLPPAQVDKRSPASVTVAEAASLLTPAPGEDAFTLLQTKFFGLCPLVCRAIAARAADASPERLAESLVHTVQQAADGHFSSVILEDPVKKNRDFTVIDTPFPVVEHFDEPSAMLDAFFSAQEEAARLASRTALLLKPMKTIHQRLAKKIQLQREELKRTLSRDEYRKKGDILNANLYQIPRGVSSVTLPDYYDENGGNIVIPLDIRLNPQQNAQKYYAEYAKLKSAKTHLETLIASGERELSFLENVLYDLSVADRSALTRLEAELTELGYLKPRRDDRKRRGKPHTLPALAPLTYTVDGGYTVYVGRTAKQNEELTFHTAGKNDLWFHVKNAPGSHVILFCAGEEPSALAYTQAATLAAQHSSLKGGGKIDVDYCRVKYVKKMPNAMPGMVTYDHYNTAVVTL
ncbi:MAG: NFACT RNA binding domain-containing protein [Eubacteriales bacterium]|nr:NFACT RNA binding domain-containing protein [Eubacteriales bacterium]MDY5347244.1 NFACT RNA binding domain-containing protein [Eubacteriales bacterium]